MAILRSFTPLVEPIALDEAFLDVARRAPHPRHRARDRAARSARRVRAETGLTVVGRRRHHQAARQAGAAISPSPTASSSSSRAPSSSSCTRSPVERLWGVGPGDRNAARRARRRDGRRPRRAPGGHARRARSATRTGRHLHALAWNRDERPVEPDQVGEVDRPRGDVPGRPHRPRRARPRGRAPGRRRRRRGCGPPGCAGRTVQLKVRFARLPHRSPGRAPSPSPPTSPPTSATVARALLDDGSTSADGVRLLGVSVQQLAPAAGRPASDRPFGARARRRDRRPDPTRPPTAPGRRSTGRRWSGRSTRCGPASVLAPSGPRRPEPRSGRPGSTRPR